MTSGQTNANDDPRLAVAREEAEGVEVFVDPTAREQVTVRSAEEAEGVEAFANPDGVISPTTAREDDPGHEALTADQAGFDVEGDEYRPAEESWEG
jgi:hypothetical protein